MSSLTLERLLFDPSDPTNNPLLGSFLLGAGGAVITSTNVSSVEALDVNVINSLAIDVDGIYNVSTNTDPDNMGIIGHTRAASPGDAEQVERSTVGVANADSVVAANVHGLDVNGFLMGYNGSTWDRVTSTSGALDVNISANEIDLEVVGNVADDGVDSGNPVKVGSRAHSGVLTAVSTDNDRADLLSDMYRRIFINDAPSIACKAVNVAVPDTAGGVALPGTALAGRTRLMVQNIGSEPIYVGESGVTTTAGLRLDKGATLSLELGSAVSLFGIAPLTKTVNVRVLELA